MQLADGIPVSPGSGSAGGSRASTQAPTGRGAHPPTATRAASPPRPGRGGEGRPPGPDALCLALPLSGASSRMQLWGADSQLPCTLPSLFPQKPERYRNAPPPPAARREGHEGPVSAPFRDAFAA